MKMDLIFVSSGRHAFTEGLIKKATGGQYAHAALGIKIEGRYYIVEAVRPAIRLSPADIFMEATEKQILSVEIFEEQRKEVVHEALSLVGQPYGVDDCVIGGTHDVIGDAAATVLNRILDNEDSLNCSGLQTRLIRQAFPNYMKGEDESMITPEAARLYALNFFPDAEVKNGC